MRNALYKSTALSAVALAGIAFFSLAQPAAAQITGGGGGSGNSQVVNESASWTTCTTGVATVTVSDNGSAPVTEYQGSWNGSAQCNDVVLNADKTALWYWQNAATWATINTWNPFNNGMGYLYPNGGNQPNFCNTPPGCTSNNPPPGGGTCTATVMEESSPVPSQYQNLPSDLAVAGTYYVVVTINGIIKQLPETYYWFDYRPNTIVQWTNPSPYMRSCGPNGAITAANNLAVDYTQENPGCTAVPKTTCTDPW